LPDTLDERIGALQTLLLDNSVLIACAVISAWLLTEIALKLVRHSDKRINFLADFLQVPPDTIIPIPPGNALYYEFSRKYPGATPETQLPAGAPSLQGTYLVHAKGGMTLVAIHNFDILDVYPDPEEPELRDFITPSLAQSGRLVAHRLPVDIEQDMVQRVNMVEFLLQAKFGYPGKLRGALILRDADNIAPDPQGSMAENGSRIVSASFEESGDAMDALEPIEDPMEARNFDKISKWFTSYAGRQTSPLRMMRRLGTLAVCVAILSMGERTLSADLIKSLLEYITGTPGT
jgi:hypothetical protein